MVRLLKLLEGPRHSDFGLQPSEHGKNKCLLFGALQFVVIHHGIPRKLTQNLTDEATDLEWLSQDHPGFSEDL